MSNTEPKGGAATGMDGAGTPSRTSSETSPRWANLPNQITVSRMILSVVFFALLILDHSAWFGDSRPLALNLSMGLFVLTAATDFVDGYLARKWEIVSTFGRIADPIADKIFICGSFVLLVKTSPLVPAWFPVIIISREFLISGLRSFLESSGIAFGAGISGKLKMGLQSVTVPVVLFQTANYPDSTAWQWIVVAFLAATALLTVASSIDYVRRARQLLRRS